MLCDTCMDIVILMSRTVIGSVDRLQIPMTHDHNAVGLSSCGQLRSSSSSMLRSSCAVDDCTHQDNSVDGSHVEKRSEEALRSAADKVNVRDDQSENTYREFLTASTDRHHLRSRYYNELMVVVVLWSLSVA